MIEDSNNILRQTHAGTAAGSLDRCTEGRTGRLLRQLFDLNTVYEIGCQFSAVLDSKALLEGMLLTTIGQLGVGAAAVVVRKPGDRDGGITARWKGWPDVAAEDWATTLDESFASLFTAAPYPILAAELQPRLEPDSPAAHLLSRLKCELVAPLMTRDCLHGFLFTAGKLSESPLTSSDLQFLELLARQFAVAIENAALYESERRDAHDLIQARERLMQSEKMATLGRLSVAIAHEINNPLSIIRNYLQLIDDSLPDRDGAKDALEMVTEEVERIARIVRQLLDAFRPDAGRPSAVDTGDVLRGVFDFLAPELQHAGIEVRLPPLDSIPYVIAREDALRQVFLNLALNAKDAMPHGGVLDVRSDVTEGTVTFTFADQGEGIQIDDPERLFDAFFTTKEPDRGTGLGLSISRGILEGFGATIEACNSSEPGVGALFRITLQRVEAFNEPRDRLSETR